MCYRAIFVAVQHVAFNFICDHSLALGAAYTKRDLDTSMTTNTRAINPCISPLLCGAAKMRQEETQRVFQPALLFLRRSLCTNELRIESANAKRTSTMLLYSTLAQLPSPPTRLTSRRPRTVTARATTTDFLAWRQGAAPAAFTSREVALMPIRRSTA